ncbi:hypothetical protein PI95_025215 [Hassallia byssoidea VB512170]|uniref:Uncharacterized protein n=1 Tax=Hassallia byssoidea VB512170 TaxID=1304833 RepID=A0A846HEK0_9CYAN|nr:hypothetical protein [Hassalia byssoidea]MBW4571847.1 hypothetical protein [Tolypothrix carrinoi HA7290-LM1]NEU75765.1 hypothetical protein [Hassalia byssoidea VB512170]
MAPCLNPCSLSVAAGEYRGEAMVVYGHTPVPEAASHLRTSDRVFFSGFS